MPKIILLWFRCYSIIRGNHDRGDLKPNHLSKKGSLRTSSFKEMSGSLLVVKHGKAQRFALNGLIFKFSRGAQ